ncbi:MAG: hypothetical protein AAF483_11115 [Planctomycetota bacterium]
MRTLVFISACIVFGSVCHGQVVQQPVFRNFSYSGSAWVPDQGTASLGGNLSSRSGTVTRGFGPYAQRSSGSSLGGRSLTASVTIIDLTALDEAILNQPVGPSLPAANGGPPPQAPQSKALMSLAGVGTKIINTTQPYDIDQGFRAADPNAYNRALKGHALTIRKTAVESLAESDVRFYLSEGLKAEKAGRIVSARVYYRMALDAMTPEMMERYKKVISKRKMEEEAAKTRAHAGSVRF